MTTFDTADLTEAERAALADIRRRKAELIDEIDGIRGDLTRVNDEIDSLDIVDDHDGKPRHRAHALGRKRFNQHPKQGIEFMVEQGLLEYNSQSVAEFLFKGECLSKASIGDYMGEKDDFHIEVLNEFVKLHDFANLILVQALRQFLWSFRLPGEAQKIDRMMECFAQRFCDCNPGVFRTTDCCYILSFAIIMLNTSTHNPAVKDKPTIEQFMSMNRGIDDGKDLPADLLRGLYASIQEEEFKIPEDESTNELMHTFFNPDRQGWLEKQSANKIGGKSWKRRWFILSDNCLYYFESTSDKEPRGIIPLENVQVREVTEKQRPNSFEIYSTNDAEQYIKACKTDGEGKVVEGKHKIYRMSAESKIEKDEWVKSIDAAIRHSPLYGALRLQKQRMGDTPTRLP